jgi:hypothetical protein
LGPLLGVSLSAAGAPKPKWSVARRGDAAYLRDMVALKVPNWLYNERELTRTSIAMRGAGGLRVAADYGSGWEECSDDELAKANEMLLRLDYIKVFEGLASDA